MLSFPGSAGVIAALIGSVLLIGRGIEVARDGESDLVSSGKLLLYGAVVGATIDAIRRGETPGQQVTGDTPQQPD